MQKVRFAYNPKAGETVITDWLDNIIDIYQRGGYSIMPYRLAFTETEETDLLDDIDGSYHHILVAGGDGTVNYVVNLLKRRNLDLPVAVLPTGTANDFANTLGVPVGHRESLPENSRRRDQTRRSGPGQRRVFRQRIQLRAFYRRLAKDADDTQEHLRQAGLLFRRARRTAQLPEDAHFDRVRRRQLRGTVADFSSCSTAARQARCVSPTCPKSTTGCST